jgi:hypothetical protein
MPWYGVKEQATEFQQPAMQSLYAEVVKEATAQQSIPLDSPGSPFRRVGNENG